MLTIVVSQLGIIIFGWRLILDRLWKVIWLHLSHCMMLMQRNIIFSPGLISRGIFGIFHFFFLRLWIVMIR